MSEATQTTELEELLERINTGRLKIAEALERLDKLQTAALMVIMNNGGKPSDLALLFGAMRTVDATFEESIKPVSEMVTELKKRKIPEAFERDNITSQTLISGARVGLTTRILVHVPADKRTPAYEWLANNGAGDLVKPTVNASSLASFAKSYMEEEGKDLPEEFFNVHIAQEATYTRGKPKDA